MLLRIEHSLRCTVQAYVRTIERVHRVVKQLATCSLMASAGATGKSQTKKASSRTKKTTFKVKERRELLLVLEGNDYADLVNTAIQKLQPSAHLLRYPERAAFVSSVPRSFPVTPGRGTTCRGES